MFKYLSKVLEKKLEGRIPKVLSLGGGVNGDFFSFFLVYILIFLTSELALLV